MRQITIILILCLLYSHSQDGYGKNQIHGLIRNSFNCPLYNVNILDEKDNLIALTDSNGAFSLDVSSNRITYFKARKYGYLDEIIQSDEVIKDTLYIKLDFDNEYINTFNNSQISIVDCKEAKPDTLVFILRGQRYYANTTYYPYHQLMFINGYENSDFKCCANKFLEKKFRPKIDITFIRSEYSKNIVGNEGAEICLINLNVDNIIELYTAP